MQIDREELYRHYASLSDEELMALDREDLTPIAQEIYDRELQRRELSSGTAEEAEEALPPALAEDAGDTETDWIENAACACSFQAGGAGYADQANRACEILRSARIPSQVVSEHQDMGPDLLNVMVPGALTLKAASVLDRDLFNQELEASWRSHFEELSDNELHALDTAVLCAGLLDRAARLKRAYEGEVARRQAAM